MLTWYSYENHPSIYMVNGDVGIEAGHVQYLGEHNDGESDIDHAHYRTGAVRGPC